MGYTPKPAFTQKFTGKERDTETASITLKRATSVRRKADLQARSRTTSSPRRKTVSTSTPISASPRIGTGTPTSGTTHCDT